MNIARVAFKRSVYFTTSLITKSGYKRVYDEHTSQNLKYLKFYWALL